MNSSQIHTLVNDTVNEIKTLLIEKLKDINPLQRALIYARIINFLYVEHFRAGMLFSNEKVRELELKFSKENNETENE